MQHQQKLQTVLNVRIWMSIVFMKHTLPGNLILNLWQVHHTINIDGLVKDGRTVIIRHHTKL